MAALAYKYEVLPSSNHSPRSNFADYNGAVTHICVHHWGIDGQRHDRVVAWLRGKAGGTSNTGSSAHYVCSANLVTNLVAESRAAWAAIGANGYAIHIEMRPEMSSGDWATLVQLCANIEERRGSMQYTDHGRVAPTQCPGRYAARLGELVQAVNTEHKRRGNDLSDPRRKAKGGAKTPAASSKVAKPRTAPAARSSYTGASIVEYLKSVGQDSSYSNRARLAAQHGISGYRGTAAQNTSLLNRLRAPGSTSKSISAMAREIIQGRHGNGHKTRQNSLGVDSETYSRVRAEVNKRLR